MRNVIYLGLKLVLFALVLFNAPACHKKDSAEELPIPFVDTTRLGIPGSATVLTLSGLNFNLYNSMPEHFRGFFSRSPYAMVQVKYPASLASNSISKGVEMLNNALKSTPGKKIVMAHSQGAQVCSRWLREHANDNAAPGPDDLIFILTGNPLRSTGGYIIGRPEVGGTIGLPTPTDTRWKIIDFARRYDGWADWVQDENNQLAVENADKGKQTLHLQYDEVDIFSTTHTIWSKNNTTYLLTRQEVPPAIKGESKSPAEIQEIRMQIEKAYSNRPAGDTP